MSARIGDVAWAATIVLLAAALYEALVAFGVIPLGHEPGDGAPAETLVLVAALLAFLGAIGACLVRAFGEPVGTSLAWLALAPAGFAFALARWYGFDPYYLPTLRRYSTNTVHGPWMAGLGVAAALACVLSFRLRRGGALVTAGVLLVTALTAWWLPVGK